MNLKNYLITKNSKKLRGQSVLEFCLLVAASIAGVVFFLGSIFGAKNDGGAFSNHFDTAFYYITGAPQP